jgi:hypothetical protein
MSGISGFLKNALALGVARWAPGGNRLVGLDGADWPKVMAVLDAAPAIAQVYCSPIVGDSDTGAQSAISTLWHEVTGMLLPEAGVLTEIHAVFQGNGSNPVTPKNVRWTVASVKRDPSAATGLAIDQVIDSGVTSVAGNAAGDVTLATGKSLAVPPQFVVCIKAATDAQNLLNVQNMRSGGPIPGVVGALAEGALVAATGYSTSTFDMSTVTPAALVSGEKIQPSLWNGLAVYIKWRKA